MTITSSTSTSSTTTGQFTGRTSLVVAAGRGGTDQHGNPMSGTSDQIDLYDHALDRLLRFDEAVLELAGRLFAEAADAPMALAMLAYLSLSSTDQPDVAGARDIVAALDAMPKNERETMHTAAIDAWASGDWVGAAKRLDDVLQRWPADLLALQLGHQLDFALGDNQNLRDRVARSLPAVDPAHGHHALVHGMLAFGLEEAGSYAQAEQAGLTALAGNLDDVWALHAVVHVMEMQGRVDEGIRFMVGREADWGAGNLFKVHNWWHLGVYCLEAGQLDDALRIYDREIHTPDSAGVPLEMLDASAMLWRFHLDGEDTGGRFDALADAWATRTELEPWYVFNDVHATMALAGAGRLVEARAVIKRLDGYLDSAAGTNAAMTAEIGLPASRALVAHAEGRYSDVVAELAPIRRTLARFGGSHAQRDVLQRTLLDAAIRVGDHHRAQALLNERLTLRPTSVYGWTQQARLARLQGDGARAEEATTFAVEHRARFATPIPRR